MNNKPDLSIILPCYNEDKNIPLIVEQFARFWPGINFELILVNNGSRDDTAGVLKQLQNRYSEFIRIVTIEKNIGYGHGIMAGLKNARGELLAYSHADIQTPPEDVFRAYELAKGCNAEIKNILIKGMRIERRKEELFFTRGLEKITCLLLGYRLRDVNAQPKLFHRGFLEKLAFAPVDFSFDIYVMYKAVQSGFKIITFPVEFRRRLHGKSNWAATPFKRYKTIAGCLRNIFFISMRNISDRNNPIGQLIRFCVVGTFGATINYVTFYLLYKFFSVYYVVSSLIGFCVGVRIIFPINRKWTFDIDHGHISGQLLKFIFLLGFSFLVNGISVFFFTEKAHVRPEVSQVATMAVTTVINFVGSKFWVFRKETGVRGEK